jgi:Methyltransferase domain
MSGIEVDLDRQSRVLLETCAPFEREYRGNPFYAQACASGCGPGFGYIEAQALHGFVRHWKPKSIIEVGSGVSTFCMLAATSLSRDSDGRAAKITSIEPYPSAWLRLAPVTLIEKPVQEVPLARFDALAAGDILFIDSSHAVRTGGDVNFLILEVLPRLQPGVLVHFHDIYFPFDYPRDALNTLSQAQETALLHAFLIGNRGVRILFSLSHLHYERQQVLAEVFPEYRPQPGENGLRDALYRPFEAISEHFPSSLYLEIVDPHQ